ncbi:MAG: ATP phosphoribosyltransferase [Gammaproteobacteria bacterium]|nr:ATP phosphoribosyltransferase [Gammaproteobacteria bacterium]
MLTVAIAKGRLLSEALPLLAKSGIKPLLDPFKSRKLCLETNQPDLRLLIVRPWDVPTYVTYGAANLGIVGKDVLSERGYENIYEPLDLGIGRCRLMLAGRVPLQGNVTRLKVATKYVRVTHQWFAAKGIQADIIPLTGSLELAAVLGLSDYIADLVDTGRTLKSNGLLPLEEILSSTAHLIVNKAALKMNYSSIDGFVQKIKRIV